MMYREHAGFVLRVQLILYPLATIGHRFRGVRQIRTGTKRAPHTGKNNNPNVVIRINLQGRPQKLAPQRPVKAVQLIWPVEGDPRNATLTLY